MPLVDGMFHGPPWPGQPAPILLRGAPDGTAAAALHPQQEGGLAIAALGVALGDTVAPILQGIGSVFLGGGDDSAVASASTATTTTMPYTTRHFPALVESIFIAILLLDTAGKKMTQLVKFLEENLATSNPKLVYDQRKEFEELMQEGDNEKGRAVMSYGLGFLLLSNLRLAMYFILLPMDIDHNPLHDKYTRPELVIWPFAASVLFGTIMFILVDRPGMLRCCLACRRRNTSMQHMQRFAGYIVGNTTPPLWFQVLLGILDIMWYSMVKWAFSPFVCHYPDTGEDAFMLTAPDVKCWVSTLHWCLLSLGFLGLIGLLSWQLSAVLRKFRGHDPPFEGTYVNKEDDENTIVIETMRDATGHFIRIKEKLPLPAAHCEGVRNRCRGLLNFGNWYKVDRIFCDVAGKDKDKTQTCLLSLDREQQTQLLFAQPDPREKPQLKVFKSGKLQGELHMDERGSSPRSTRWRRISYPSVPFSASPLPLFGVVLTKLVGTLMWASFGHRSKDYKWVVVITMSSCSVVIAATMRRYRPYAFDVVNTVSWIGMSVAAVTPWLSILLMNEAQGSVCQYLLWIVTAAVFSSVCLGRRRFPSFFKTHFFRIHVEKPQKEHKSLKDIRDAIAKMEVLGNGDEKPEQVWFREGKAPVHILDIRDEHSDPSSALSFKEWIDKHPAEASWLYAPAVDTNAPEFREVEGKSENPNLVLQVVKLRNPMFGVLRPRFLHSTSTPEHADQTEGQKTTTKRYDMETAIGTVQQLPHCGDTFKAGRCFSVYFENPQGDELPLELHPPSYKEKKLRLCIGKGASCRGSIVCRVYERNRVMYQSTHYENEGGAGAWQMGGSEHRLSEAEAPGQNIEFEITQELPGAGCRVRVCKTSIIDGDVRDFASECREPGSCGFRWPFWQRLQDVDDETRRVIALGVAGAGKSTLISALCGYTSGNTWHAMGGASAGGVTKQIRGTLAEAPAGGGGGEGTSTLYIDIPGVQEGQLGAEDSATHTEDEKRLDHSIGRLCDLDRSLHAGRGPFLDHFLLVVHAADARRPQRLERSLTTLHRYFGPDITRSMTVVFTNFQWGGREPEEIADNQRSCVSEFSTIFVGVFDSALPLGLCSGVEEAEARQTTRPSNHPRIPCFFIDTVAAFPDKRSIYPHSSCRDAQQVLDQIKRRIDNSAIEGKRDSSIQFKTSWWPPTITGCMNEEMVLIQGKDILHMGVDMDIQLQVKIPEADVKAPPGRRNTRGEGVVWDLCPWYIAPLSSECEFHLDESLELPHIPAHSPRVFTLDVYVEWKEQGTGHRELEIGGDAPPAENRPNHTQDSRGQQDEQGEGTFLACGSDGSGEAAGSGGYHIRFKSDGRGGGSGAYTVLLFGVSKKATENDHIAPQVFPLDGHAAGSGHLTYSFDGTQACLYMEGVLLASKEAPPNFRFRANGHAEGPKSPLRLGTASCFVKNLCIYERALEPDCLVRRLRAKNEGIACYGLEFDGLRFDREGKLKGEPRDVIGLQHYKVLAGQERLSKQPQPRTAEYSLWLGISPSKPWLHTEFGKRRQAPQRPTGSGGAGAEQGLQWAPPSTDDPMMGALAIMRAAGRFRQPLEKRCIDLERLNGSLQQPKRYDRIRRVTEIVNRGFRQNDDADKTFDDVMQEAEATNKQLRLVREKEEMQTQLQRLEADRTADMERVYNCVDHLRVVFAKVQKAEESGDLAELEAARSRYSEIGKRQLPEAMSDFIQYTVKREEERATECMGRWRDLKERFTKCRDRAGAEREKQGSCSHDTASRLFDHFTAALNGGLSLDRRNLEDLLQGTLLRESTGYCREVQECLVRKVVNAKARDLRSFDFADLEDCLEFLADLGDRRRFLETAKGRIEDRATRVCDLRQRFGQLSTLMFFSEYSDRESAEKATEEFRLRNPEAFEGLSSVTDGYGAEFMLRARSSCSAAKEPAGVIRLMGQAGFWSPLVSETLREIFCQLAKIRTSECGVPGVPHHTQIITILTFCELLDRGGTDAQIRTLIAEVGTGEGKPMLIAVLAVYIVLKKNMRVHVIGGDEKLALRDFEGFRPLFDYAREKKLGCEAGRARFAVACATSARGEEDLVTRIPPEAWIVYCEARHVVSHYSRAARETMDFSAYQETVLIIDEVDELVIDRRPTEHIVYGMGGWEVGDGYTASDYAKETTFTLMFGPGAGLDSMPDRDDPRRHIYSELLKISAAVDEFRSKPEEEQQKEYVKHKNRWTRVEGSQPNENFESNFLECLRQREDPTGYLMEWYERLFVVSKPRVFWKYHSILGFTGTVGSEGEQQFVKDTYRAEFFKVPPFLQTCREADGSNVSFHEAQWAGTEQRAGTNEPVCMHGPLAGPAVVESNRACQFKSIERLAFQAARSVPVLVITRSSGEAADLFNHLRRRCLGRDTPAGKGRIRLLSQCLNTASPKEYKDNLNAATRPIVYTCNDEKERCWCITVTDPAGGRGNDYQMADEGVDKLGGFMVVMSHIPLSMRDWFQFKRRTARQKWRGQYCAVLNAERQEGLQPREMEEGQLEGKFYADGGGTPEADRARSRRSVWGATRATPYTPYERRRLSEAVAAGVSSWHWVPDSPDDLVAYIHNVANRDSKHRIERCMGVHKAGFLVNEICEKVWHTCRRPGQGTHKYLDLVDPEKRARFITLCSRYAEMSAKRIEQEAKYILDGRADYALPESPQGIAEYEPYAKQPKAVIFVLDVSKSMDTAVGGGQDTRLDVCKGRMASLLTNADIVTKQDHIGVVAFSDTHEYKAELALATDEHRAKVGRLVSADALNTIEWRGGTHLYETLLHYSQVLCHSREYAELEKWIILLADGEDDSDLATGQRRAIPPSTVELRVTGEWLLPVPEHHDYADAESLDYSAFLFDKNMNYIKYVDYNYTLDALGQEDEGIMAGEDYDPPKRITVMRFYLSKLDQNVHYIYVTASTQERKLTDFADPMLKLETYDSEGVLTSRHSYPIGGGAQGSEDHTATIMCALSRTLDNAWSLLPLADLTHGTMLKATRLAARIQERHRDYDGSISARATCAEFFAERSRGLNLVSMVVSDVGCEAAGTLQSFCKSVKAQGGVGLCVEARVTDADIQRAFAEVQECLMMDEGGHIEMD